MKRPNRKRYINRAGIVTVNYTKALEKYIDFLEAEKKQFAISGVVKSSYCECDSPIIRTSVNMDEYCGCCGEDIKQ